MEYNEFINCVRDEVEKLCEENERVIINSIRKNNSQKHDAILIKKEGDNASPSVYLNYFYEEYKNGKNISEIADSIVRLDRESRDKLEFDLEEFYQWDKVKEKIFCRLINRVNNPDILKKIPYKEVYDLAMVYYCTFNVGDFDLASTMIHSSYLENWGITEEELHKTAIDNTARVQRPVLMSVNDMVINLLDIKNLDQDDRECILRQIGADEEGKSMYVLTNEMKLLGSICMVYEDLLHDFAIEHGSFYIIPSSIHEVIFVPDRDDIEPSGLLNMIIDVNDSQVPKEDILSYNLYYYDVTKHKIKVINNVKQKIL